MRNQSPKKDFLLFCPIRPVEKKHFIRIEQFWHFSTRKKRSDNGDQKHIQKKMEIRNICETNGDQKHTQTKKEKKETYAKKNRERRTET